MKVGKPSQETTREDYNLAFRRAVYNKAMDGLELTNEEIKQADKALIEAGLYQSYYNLQGSLDGLKANHQKSGNEMPITVGKQNIEYARRAGQAVLQYREYKAKRTEATIESGKNYVNGALGGFVEKPYNAVVNNINGLSEPFRAGEKALFGTGYIPELPRSTIGDKSAYWQQNRYGVSLNQIGEGATTLQVGIMTGKPLFNSRVGALLGVQVGAYNIGVGAGGTDPLHPGREMSGFERGSRIVGGTLGVASAPFSTGGRALANDALAFPNTARNAVNNFDDIFKNPPTFRPQGELVTPEGLRIKTDVEQIPDNVLLSKAKTQEANPFGRRNLDSHEGVSGVQEGKQVGHTKLKHVGKSERWLQDRIRNENVESASSFYNESVGNRTVGKFVKENRKAIEQWLKTKENVPFEGKIDVKQGIGLVVNRSKKGTPLAAEEATKATIRLVKDNSEYGWHLFTVKLQK